MQIKFDIRIFWINIWAFLIFISEKIYNSILHFQSHKLGVCKSFGMNSCINRE